MGGWQGELEGGMDRLGRRERNGEWMERFFFFQLIEGVDEESQKGRKGSKKEGK